MRTPRLYWPGQLATGTDCRVDGPSAHYVSRVLRRKRGDALILFDGRGGEYDARIEQLERDHLIAGIIAYREAHRDSPLRCHLGLALSRGERMDWAIQKATELGVTEITPIVAERCELKLRSDQHAKRTAHWQQVATSASEQCGRTQVPAVASPTPLDTWLAGNDTGLALVCTEDGPGMDHYRAAWTARPDSPGMRLLVGPEGGLTPAEVTRAVAQGFGPVGLGPRVLRTETAPVVALTLAQFLWGDLRGGGSG